MKVNAVSLLEGLVLMLIVTLPLWWALSIVLAIRMARGQ